MSSLVKAFPTQTIPCDKALIILAPVWFGQREPVFLPLNLWCWGAPEFDDQITSYHDINTTGGEWTWTSWTWWRSQRTMMILLVLVIILLLTLLVIIITIIIPVTIIITLIITITIIVITCSYTWDRQGVLVARFVQWTRRPGMGQRLIMRKMMMLDDVDAWWWWWWWWSMC